MKWNSIFLISNKLIFIQLESSCVISPHSFVLYSEGVTSKNSLKHSLKYFKSLNPTSKVICEMFKLVWTSNWPDFLSRIIQINSDRLWPVSAFNFVYKTVLLIYLFHKYIGFKTLILIIFYNWNCRLKNISSLIELSNF